MANDLTKKPKTPSIDPIPWDVGDTCWILFWRLNNPNPYAMGTSETGPGQWDVLYGRVVSVGKSIHGVELFGPCSAWYGNSDRSEAIPGSLLRYVNVTDLFRTRELAISIANTRTTPQ